MVALHKDDDHVIEDKRKGKAQKIDARQTDAMHEPVIVV